MFGMTLFEIGEDVPAFGTGVEFNQEEEREQSETALSLSTPLADQHLSGDADHGIQDDAPLHRISSFV